MLDNYPDIFAKGMEGTPQQDLDDFYSKFRQAIISNDKNAITSMTAFPFTIDSIDKSTGESTIIKNYEDDKSFQEDLDTLLKTDVGTSNTSETMRSFIKRNKTIDPNNTCSEFDNLCETGKFLFSKSLGKWYFVSIIQ